MEKRAETPCREAFSQKPRPPSMDRSGVPQDSKEQSNMLSILPSMVQSRIPHLSTLRRTVSTYSTKVRGVGRLTSQSSSDEFDAMLPSRASMGVDEMEIVRMDGFQEMHHEREDERKKMRKQPHKSAELTENQSGIGWKFAGQGLTLLSLAVTESRALSKVPVSKTVSPSFARKLYINALTYLIHGLPADLAAEESLSIRTALPPGVASPLRVEVCSDHCRHLCNLPVESSGRLKSPEPSVLHRTLAYAIIHIFLLVQFVLPYVKVVLQAAYEYERTHHMSEKVLGGTIEALDGMGRIGIKSSSAVWGSSLALGLAEVVTWVMDGVSGGIQEGLGEGIARVGIRKDDERSESRHE